MTAKYSKAFRRNTRDDDFIGDQRRESWGIYKSIEPPETIQRKRSFWCIEYDRSERNQED